MPLDSVKSVVYRSFIACDDPKGVVDCNMIKISKVNSQKLEQKIRAHRTSRNSNKGLVSQVEKKEELISEEMRGRNYGQSSLPLMEVYQGAEKLNHMVGSWSKGMRSEMKTEEIAEDLLEGTSSLRESLIMLAKLQGASNESIRLKMTYPKSFSCHLEDECYPVEVQRSKLSRHGSSRNGADEVKKVIRDSLVKRESMSNVTIGEHKSCFRDINSDLGSEIPSTSSSQSSMIDDNVNCFHVSTSQQKNLKRNNLIAKLMGLEEIPSKSLQTTPKKEFEFKKVSGYKTSLFGIDATQSAAKSKSVINKEDHKKGTLREKLEKIPVNRLRESDSDIEFKIHCPYSYNNDSKQRLKDVPPTVLIKHKPLPPDELEEHRAHVSSKDDAFNQKAILRSTKKIRSFYEFDFHGGILSSDKLHRKQNAEGIPLKQIAQEERKPKPKPKEVRKLRKDTVDTEKLRKDTVDTKKKAAEKLKTSSSMPDMPHETEPIDRKVLTSKKLTKATRKPVEKEFAKEKVVSRPQHQEKVTSTNPRKNKTHKQRSSLPDSVPRQSVSAISNDRDRQKKEEPVLPQSEVNSFTHMVEAKKDDESTDTNESVDLPINRKTTTLMALIAMENEFDECDTKIIECCNENPNSLPPLSPKLEINTSVVKDIDPNSRMETDIESCGQGTNLKALLLRSSSFLCHAGEVFDLNLNDRTMLQTASGCNNLESLNTKPFIDCAIELVKRKGHYDLQVANSLLLGGRRNTKIEISVEKLVEEVNNDIDTLTSYQTICGNNLLVDTLYAVLSRDLRCKEVMNGMWDFGWKKGFSRSESEEVVNDIEKLILSGLIEESFT
ncbi:uncharacterized protein LOC120070755 [Benincasa hispida]|uniref:uncharacterized protein LOC120070755 n=1 Tax=Benincasa hispida TaxID=102211 RepID=UPI00190188E7|nr:uncharacterized protein LOC120070755 [Benincasa hispida]